MKKLETVDDLIQQMREKGISFSICSDEEASAFLTNNSYYKKISSYQSNFQYGMKDGHKIYKNLDFAYLIELSTIDMEFRALVMRMCLNLEHSLKVHILNACLEAGDDGYSLIHTFFSENIQAKHDFDLLTANPYCRDLVAKYLDNTPIWVYLEVISFGSLCKLYKWISVKYGILKHRDIDILFNISRFRNAAAHNYCLLNHLTKRDACIPKPAVRNFAKSLVPSGFNVNSRLQSQTVCDFISLIYEFGIYVKSSGILSHTSADIKSLFNDRMLRNKDYFASCESITLSYNFVKLALDKWLESL